MKTIRIIIGILCLFIPISIIGQELTIISIERDDGSIREQYEVLKKRKTIRNGNYKRFYANGQVNINANYQNNLLDGAFESKHPNGNTAAAGAYFSGKKSGLWTYSDAEGICGVKGSYTDDMEEGPWVYQNPDGYRVNTNYNAGKANGLWELWQGEQLLAACNFSNDLPGHGSLKLTTDSIYRYVDSLYHVPEIKAWFPLLKFSGKARINGPWADEPQFQDGLGALRDYLGDYVHLPLSLFPAGRGSSVPKQTCYVQITVSQFGTIEKVEIIRSFSKELDREIIKAVKGMPIWMPAINRNIPVRSMITIPFSFQLFMAG